MFHRISCLQKGRGDSQFNCLLEKRSTVNIMMYKTHSFITSALLDKVHLEIFQYLFFIKTTIHTCSEVNSTSLGAADIPLVFTSGKCL